MVFLSHRLGVDLQEDSNTTNDRRGVITPLH